MVLAPPAHRARGGRAPRRRPRPARLLRLRPTRRAATTCGPWPATSPASSAPSAPGARRSSAPGGAGRSRGPSPRCTPGVVSRLVVVATPHPLALRRAVRRRPWRHAAALRDVAFFQLPRLPERALRRDGGARAGELLAAGSGPAGPGTRVRRGGRPARGGDPDPADLALRAGVLPVGGALAGASRRHPLRPGDRPARRGPGADAARRRRPVGPRGRGAGVGPLGGRPRVPRRCPVPATSRTRRRRATSREVLLRRL